jgi:hypothetical protein
MADVVGAGAVIDPLGSASLPLAPPPWIYWKSDEGLLYFYDDNTSQWRLVPGACAIVKSYSFTSQGIGSGTYYKGGWYAAPAADANLTQAGTTQTFRSANQLAWAKAFIVAGGAGTVDTGQVGLRVTGTSIDDNGNRTAADNEVLTDDITGLSLNDYLQTTKKWSGQITFELYVVSGAPTAYSLDFNYGLVHVENYCNQDFTVGGFEIVGQAAANDSSFDIELIHHTDQNWTYSAAAFTPGPSTPLAQLSTDIDPEDQLVNGADFVWKRDNINQLVDGTGGDGIMFRITTGANNSIQTMDMHVNAFAQRIGA